ncbi:uncharacterized protein N7515_003216 [Penicillium bovifimosum]|uniref:Uncharacterized protein n=1 Tax=Penicillium bovifimosum TaxID=126998 RepID=A0A9W9H4M3_9EURO|nr:uncharacterized protein N7515_003216 [Penicillium bovifimosum]KAJ5138368.1 hypothetical protein N7515_003216 [Penicillium bovifimosum]
MSAHSADDQAQANPWTSMLANRPMTHSVDGHQQVITPFAKPSGFVPSHKVCGPSAHQHSMAMLVTDMKDKMNLSEAVSVTAEPEDTLMPLVQQLDHLSLTLGRHVSLKPPQLGERVPCERCQNPLSNGTFNLRDRNDPAKKALPHADNRHHAKLAARKSKRSKATRASPSQLLPGSILGISWDNPMFSEDNVKRFLKTRICRFMKATKNRVAKASGFEHNEFELRMPDTVYKFVVGKKPLHEVRPRRNRLPRIRFDKRKVQGAATENTSDEMDTEEDMNEGMDSTFSTLVFQTQTPN